MQVGIKFSLAVHIMLCVAYFREEKVTGDFVAASSGINPAIARKLISQLKNAALVLTTETLVVTKPEEEDEDE